MQCVILAGGLATRLGHRATQIPKTLIQVAGSPFADWQLSWLASQDVKNVLYCIGHLGRQIEDHISNGSDWGLEVTYSREGEELLGTGGALRLALDSDLLEDAFFVLYGDSYLRVDLLTVEQRFRAMSLPALMTIYRNRGRWGPSNAVLRNGKVVSYGKDSGASGGEFQWIDYGISIVERELIEKNIPPRRVYDLAWLFAEQAAIGQVAAYEVAERFYEIGSPSGLSELEHRLRASGGSTRLVSDR